MENNQKPTNNSRRYAVIGLWVSAISFVALLVTGGDESV